MDINKKINQGDLGADAARFFFLVIFVTAWIIIFPKSRITDLVFKGLPKKPDFLKK